jgi:hypothetical protein
MAETTAPNDQLRAAQLETINELRIAQNGGSASVLLVSSIT